MTPGDLESAYQAVRASGWPTEESGPWFDAMDLTLRTKYPLDHQFAIVGYAIGMGHALGATSGPGMAAWTALLTAVTKRARVEVARIDLGYGRPLRPESVVPGGGFRRRRR